MPSFFNGARSELLHFMSLIQANGFLLLEPGSLTTLFMVIMGTSTYLLGFFLGFMKIPWTVSELWREHYFQTKKIQRRIIPQNCRWSNGSYSLILPSDVASYLFKDYVNFFDSSKF